MGLQFALLLAGASALVPLPTPVGLPLRCTISPRALAVARYGSSSSKAAKAANAKGPTRRGKSVSKSASTSKATKPAGLFGRKPVVDPAPNPATPARGLFGRKAEPPPPPPPAKPAGLFGFGGSPSAARAPATQRRGGRGKPPPPSDPRSAQADAKAQRVAMRKAGLDVLKVMAQFSQEKEQRRKEREQRRTAAAAAPISAGSRGTAPFFKFSMPKLQLPTVSVPGIAAPPPPPPPPPPPSPPQRQEAERGAGVGLVGGLTGLVSTYAELVRTAPTPWPKTKRPFPSCICSTHNWAHGRPEWEGMELSPQAVVDAPSLQRPAPYPRFPRRVITHAFQLSSCTLAPGCGQHAHPLYTPPYSTTLFPPRPLSAPSSHSRSAAMPPLPPPPPPQATSPRPLLARPPPPRPPLRPRERLQLRRWGRLCARRRMRSGTRRTPWRRR